MKRVARRKGRIGSSFDEFLAEQGILEECEEMAIKQILADQIKLAMEKERLTKTGMAARMRTSRRALDRLLDARNTSVTLHTLQRAATAVGRLVWPGIRRNRRILSLPNFSAIADPEARAALEASLPNWVHELVRRGVAERKARQLALDVPDTQPVAEQIEYVDFLIQTERRGKWQNPAGFYVWALENNLGVPESFETSRRRKLREEEALGEHEAELRRLKLRADYDEFCRLEVKRKMESLYPPARLEEGLREKIKRIRHEQPEWYGRMPDPMKRETAIGMLEAEVRERAHLPGFEQWSKQDLQMRMF